MQSPKQPAWMPEANPVPLRCPVGSKKWLGWAYPDGTLELMCHRCSRETKEIRHLFNPANGLVVNIEVPK